MIGLENSTTTFKKRLCKLILTHFALQLAYSLKDLFLRTPAIEREAGIAKKLRRYTAANALQNIKCLVSSSTFEEEGIILLTSGLIIALYTKAASNKTSENAPASH